MLVAVIRGADSKTIEPIKPLEWLRNSIPVGRGTNDHDIGRSSLSSLGQIRPVKVASHWPSMLNLKKKKHFGSQIAHGYLIGSNVTSR